MIPESVCIQMAPLGRITSATVYKAIGILSVILFLAEAGTAFGDGEIVRGVLWVMLAIGSIVAYWRFAREETTSAK